MGERSMIPIPTKQEFRAAIEEFRRKERRAYVYHVALEALTVGWGNPTKMSGAIGVLLEIWNSAFYRYGPFDLAARRAVSPITSRCSMHCASGPSRA